MLNLLSRHSSVSARGVGSSSIKTSTNESYNVVKHTQVQQNPNEISPIINPPAAMDQTKLLVNSLLGSFLPHCFSRSDSAARITTSTNEAYQTILLVNCFIEV